MLNEELIKTVTGSGTITTKPLYREFMEFQPTHLPILLCNRRPRVNVNDQAMMRRIVVIPFTNIYTSTDSKTNPYDSANPHHRLRDNDLEAKLSSQEGQEQLLSWLVRGAVAWYQRGLGAMPEAVGQAFDSFHQENDTLTSFIRDSCILDKDATVNAKQFLDAYNTVAEPRIKQGALKEMMAKRRIDYSTKRGAYKGISLKEG